MPGDLFSSPDTAKPPRPSTALVYAGSPIADRGEMLSLTDMWTAAHRKHVEDGGDAAEFENRKPYEWLRSAEAKRFIAALAKTLNTGISRITETARGAGGGTFAHWQVGLAYAQYLSPEFHMWTNTVVRAHMEGIAGPAPAVVPLIPSPVRAVVADFKALFSVARLIGLDRSQCALRANKATARVHGVDLLGELGQPLIEAPHQEQLLTVTTLGQKLGGLSARATNVLLVEHGFQVADRDAKNVLFYEATDLGRPHSRMVDQDKTKGSGAPVLQLRWLTSVVEPLKAAMSKTENAA